MPTKNLLRTAGRALAHPPYPGQALPFPAEFGIEGEWVIADRVFPTRARKATPE